MIAAAPVIANAVYNALGVRIKSMPITQEKVAMSYLEKSKSEHKQEE
jgi:carbon-monoxide dehydrogenase large subunit